MRRVSVRQIATEVGWPRQKTARWLRENHLWLGAHAQGFPPTYDSRVIDLIKALQSQPHRTIADPSADWLADFTSGGEPHA